RGPAEGVASDGSRWSRTSRAGGLLRVSLKAAPAFPQGTIYTVRAVNRLLKDILDEDIRLHHVAVAGELSNFKHHTSGHMYFTLKDEYSRLRCVMFRSRNRSVSFTPREGMAVVAVGTISLYETGGDV